MAVPSVRPSSAFSRSVIIRGAVAAGAVAVAVVLGASFLAEAKKSGPAKNAPPLAEECKKDTDCALVPDDCCACNEGGAQRAITRKHREAYEKERMKRCAGTMCAQMISQDKSCSQLAFCGAGQCKLGDVPSATAP
jgi:hypothetical protein